MASILKRRGRIQVRLDERERTALVDIVAHLGEHLPATVRPAYQDRQMQAEYDRWVRPDIDTGVQADLGVIRDSLSADDQVLVLTEAQVHAWLRGFNQLRVAAGSVMGISEDGWEQTASAEMRARPEYGMLMVLGWLQEELVAALET
jgi:hypothetical protein